MENLAHMTGFYEVMIVGAVLFAAACGILIYLYQALASHDTHKGCENPSCACACGKHVDKKCGLKHNGFYNNDNNITSSDGLDKL